MKLSTKEFEIMKSLWGKSPLSCAEIIMQNDDLKDWKKNSVYSILKNLQKRNMIYVAQIRPEQRTPTHLYAPSITELDYMENAIRTNPIFSNDMILPLFQRLIGTVKKQETLDELESILNKARSELS